MDEIENQIAELKTIYEHKQRELLDANANAHTMGVLYNCYPLIVFAEQTYSEAKSNLIQRNEIKHNFLSDIKSIKERIKSIS